MGAIENMQCTDHSQERWKVASITQSLIESLSGRAITAHQ